MFHMLRSVTLGLVAAGVIWRTPFSWNTSDDGMVTPELKWPMTNFTPSPTNLLATDTPSLGSARSSPIKTWIFCPRMPPAALMSATACSVPFLSCAPKAALPPVIGPATPSLIWAEAGFAKARPRPNAKPSVSHCLMMSSSGWKPWEVRLRLAARFNPQIGEMSPGFWPQGGWRGVAAAPPQDARALVDPTVARDHLSDPHQPEAEQADPEADRVVDQIIVQRQELAIEQGKMEEAHRNAQDQHVDSQMPGRTPR